METNMSLDDFSHKCVHSTSAGGNVVKHVRALGFLIQSPFDGIYLPSNASNAIEQLFLFLLCVSHKKTTFRSLQLYPGGYMVNEGSDSLPEILEDRRPINV
jgi:hypothetical protein